VRLLETRKTADGAAAEKELYMIKVKYRADSEAEKETVEVSINSFTVVASISYLLEISTFFIPEQVFDWTSSTKSDPLPEVVLDGETGPDLVRTVVVTVQEPDFILVSDIENINSEAIMLNAEFRMNLCQRGEKLTFTAIVDKLRGHTCTFNPAMRDKTLAQILQPTNLAMHYNSDAEMGRTRIDINLNNLVLNVFPGSLKIILDSYNTFMENLAEEAEAAPSGLPWLEEEEPPRPEPDDETDTLWEAKTFGEDEVWFLKPDTATDSLQLSQQHTDQLSLASTSSLMGDEQLVFNVNNLIVTLEVGTGNNTVPMILVESKVSL
jgi:hypothetical protein